MGRESGFKLPSALGEVLAAVRWNSFLHGLFRSREDSVRSLFMFHTTAPISGHKQRETISVFGNKVEVEA